MYIGHPYMVLHLHLAATYKSCEVPQRLLKSFGLFAFSYTAHRELEHSVTLMAYLLSWLIYSILWCYHHVHSPCNYTSLSQTTLKDS